MRANRRKQPPFMTPRKWVWLGILVFVAVLILLNQFYRYVQGPVWKAERQAEEQAMKAADLKEADKAYKFVWDDTVWVVDGTNQNGEDVYVWLRPQGEPVTMKVNDGLSKADMKRQFLQAKPDAKIKHMKIGMVGGMPVWEFYYTRKQASETDTYYDFYRFADGGFVVTYRLPKQ
ncbi:DUF5590 domain-containing protein [Paenibacillus humicola]|uniref:cell wall elongation regulator TseB-like domain-containing protein n=1 Tax=Paenibacillus humicola TaxID=3110540 RepID=UPI00237C0323|nr:DUF5590 domain-containing protein [Paenibacillus humicola]